MSDHGSQEPHRYRSVIAAKRAFAVGENITAAIRAEEGVDTNPPHAIEIAYEMQSGDYARSARADAMRWNDYGAAIAAALAPHLHSGNSLLDCGTGEMTSLASTLNHLQPEVETSAFDISWSRIAQGRHFVSDVLDPPATIRSFVGDMAAIAVPDGSADVAMTVHALEPNGGREEPLLGSVFRAARRTVVLFEPCFERVGDLARKRMRSHGYVTGLEAAGSRLGADLVDLTEFSLPANRLNPTWVFVFDVSGVERRSDSSGTFECPVTRTSLRDLGDCWFSDDAGLAYPVVGGIPILRADHAILATQRSEVRNS